MAYIFAALLINEIGKKPTAESITSVLKTAGASEEDLNDGFAQAVESSLSEVDIESIKSEALSFKAAAPSETVEKAEEEKEEEEAEEEEVEEPAEEEGEEDLEGLSSMF